MDGLVVQAHDQYVLERAGISGADLGDFVLVNLFRPPVGAPMRPGAVNELFTALCRRAGLGENVVPHSLRHAFASNVQRRGVASDATFRRLREDGGAGVPGLRASREGARLAAGHAVVSGVPAPALHQVAGCGIKIGCIR